MKRAPYAPVAWLVIFALCLGWQIRGTESAAAGLHVPLRRILVDAGKPGHRTDVCYVSSDFIMS